jgi:hypothetical protein
MQTLVHVGVITAVMWFTVRLIVQHELQRMCIKCTQCMFNESDANAVLYWPPRMLLRNHYAVAIVLV